MKQRSQILLQGHATLGRPPAQHRVRVGRDVPNLRCDQQPRELSQFSGLPAIEIQIEVRASWRLRARRWRS
jgi:hypothetical protein